jgi:hypothetical protein
MGLHGGKLRKVGIPVMSAPSGLSSGSDRPVTVIKRCFPQYIPLLPAETRFPLGALDREGGATM